MATSTLEMEAVNCGVCSSVHARPVTLGRDFEYHTSDDEFQIVECENCGNMYLNPRPVKNELPRIYPPNYYSYNYDSAIHPLAIKAKHLLDGVKVRGWLRHMANRNPVFLDVGCGDGRYLRMLHHLGVPKDKLYGVELDERQIQRLTDEGFHGYCGRVEDASYELPANSFELIVLLQVLEHVENPHSMVATLSGLLCPGGVLILETPNTDSVDFRLFRNRYWGGYHFPRHWNLFNLSALRRMVEQHGMTVKEFNFLPAHSFWIFSLHHLIQDRWRMPRVARFFDPLKNLFLLALFTGFDMVRAKLGFRTSNVQVVAIKS